MNSIITAAAVFAIVTATLIAMGQGAPQTPAAGARGAAAAAPAGGAQAPAGQPATGAAAQRGGGRGRGGRTFDLPYTEKGLKEWVAYDPVKNGDYTGNCLPFGMSRNINSPHGVQLVHSNDALAMLWEQNTWFTFIPTSPGWKWPAD